jgi:hypothetical protein
MNPRQQLYRDRQTRFTEPKITLEEINRQRRENEAANEKDQGWDRGKIRSDS